MSLDYQANNSNNINIGLVFFSKDWRIVGMNEYALSLFAPAMGTLGEDFIQLHPPKSRGKVQSILNELTALRDGMPNTMIIDILGKVLMMSMSRLTLFTKDSSASWALTFMDVTEQTGASLNPLSGQVEFKKLPICENGVFYFISADQVFAIGSDGNYCRIFTSNRKFFLLMSLKTVLQRLSTPDFFRVHKSFIVNLKHIQKIDCTAEGRTHIFFDNPAIPKVPVSRRLVSALKKAIASP